MKEYKKVLILGSGALKIGEAGEFDYSGSQAIKALKEEGIKTVLINPNIATIQTSEFLADEVYFLPVNPYFVEKVLQKEKPEAILLSFGGQTALNCGMALHKRGILKKYSVEILGTSIESVIIAEDRQKFAEHLRKIGIKTPTSKASENLPNAKKIAAKIGYPVMIRAAFALGGQKSGVAQNEKDLIRIVTDALAFSSQVLIEQYLHHYKEIEYEVVRDAYDNCVTVCNMENMDPLGIHTGESVVVAPSQTLTNHEYHTLRKISIELVRSLKIVGECNVQFALNPKPDTGEDLDYAVIELNPRLSRSSALASKATGYPLAYVGAKLILGKSLMDVQNQVTKVTQSCFEPALDYVVVKIPRWDLDKFSKVDNTIGSSMKSVGEVMGIGRTFEEALQKAVRMLDIGATGMTENSFPKAENEFMPFINRPTPKRLFALPEALARGMTVPQLHTITGVDDWFLFRLQAIVECEKAFRTAPKITKELMLHAKQLGFADSTLALIRSRSELEIREERIKMGVMPSVLQIDTLAGEVPAQTNYLYMTYNASHHDVTPTGKDAVIVLGSGPYRIGSSVEFDWTCVNTAIALRAHNKKSIIINCNPETVSTDYDMSDKLYFEELTAERVMDIYDFEKAYGVIVSVGGQTPNNIVGKLAQANAHIMGTQAQDIDRAEDRTKFSKLLDDIDVQQPPWNAFTTIEDAIGFAEKVGYPVLIRPSYVLSGNAMNVCFNEEELVRYSKKATIVNTEHPIIVSKFISDAKELELDAIAQDGKIQIMAMSEHLEHAGVHSGDATIIFPPQRIYLGTEKKVHDIARKIAEALHITGPFNIQFMAKNNQVYVIEVNVRSSRTFPFISKALRINFAKVLTSAVLGKSTPIAYEYPNFVLVKASQFSFSRLEGADPVLRVEMSSTGEVACFGDSVEEAFFKAELSVGARIPQKGIFLSLGGDENKVKFLSSILRLKTLGIPLFATEKTAKFLRANKVKAKVLYKIHENKKPNILTYFQNGKIDFAVNLADINLSRDLDDDYVIRRAAIDHNIHLLTNFQKASLFIKSFTELSPEDLKIRPWSDYR